MSSKLPPLGFEKPLYIFIGTFTVYAYARIGIFGSNKVEVCYEDEFDFRKRCLFVDCIRFYSKKRNEYYTIRSFRPITISFKKD